MENRVLTKFVWRESFCHRVKMSKVQMLRALVEQRLTAAAQEIFGLFERTIAEYEEELCRSKEENERQRKQLEAVFNPQLLLHRADVQNQSLEEADIIKFTFTPVPVKSEEDDGEKPPSSQLHQRQTEHMEADGEDCEGPGPARTSDPDADQKNEDSSETEVRDDYWEETREPQSGFNSLINNEGIIDNTEEKPFSCCECGKRFSQKGKLRTHMRIHTGEKPFSCPESAQMFTERKGLDYHLKTHAGEKPFSCLQCGRRFAGKTSLDYHLKTHTGERPFSCSVCSKSFIVKAQLISHIRQHTGEKPFSCPECDRRFTERVNLDRHLRIHTGEKPFSCPECGQRFREKGNLSKHMRVHTGEKRFSCSSCGQRFSWLCQLKRHSSQCGGGGLAASPSLH